MKTAYNIFLILICYFSLLGISNSDPGYKWNIVYHGSPNISFRGISAVNASTCWVTGTKGTILHTADGGKSWQDVSIPETDSLDFRDIETFGQDTAVAMSIGIGSQSRIYRTEDGGASWQMVHQNKYQTGFYDAIAFWENGYGILQGDPIEGKLFILVTKDAGKTWKEIPLGQMPSVEDGEYAFAASGTQLITTANGHAWIGTGGVKARILHTNDYGQNWNSKSTPMIQGEESEGIFSLGFADDSLAVAIGGDYTKEQEGTDNVVFSENGGKSWAGIPNASLDFRSAIQYINGTFITVGPSGSEYSTDNGRTWKSIDGPGFHALSFGKEGIKAVWAAGRGGLIGKLIIE